MPSLMLAAIAFADTARYAMLIFVATLITLPSRRPRHYAAAD